MSVQLRFHTHVPNCLTIVIVYRKVTIEIPDSSFEWDKFIAAVDNGTEYDGGTISIGPKVVKFRVAPVYEPECRLGFTVIIPYKNCSLALKRIRTIIAEYAERGHDAFARAHPGVFE